MENPPACVPTYPGGHNQHDDDSLNVLYDPIGHKVDEDNPVLPQKLPAGHNRQFEIEVPPVFGLYFPTEHGVQADCPVFSAYVPRAQSVQAVGWADLPS